MVTISSLPVWQNSNKKKGLNTKQQVAVQFGRDEFSGASKNKGLNINVKAINPVSGQLIGAIEKGLQQIPYKILEKLLETDFKIIASRTVNDAGNKVDKFFDRFEKSYITYGRYNVFNNKLILADYHYGEAWVYKDEQVEEPVIRFSLAHEFPEEIRKQKSLSRYALLEEKCKPVKALYKISPPIVKSTTVHELFHAVDYNLGDTPLSNRMTAKRLAKLSLFFTVVGAWYTGDSLGKLLGKGGRAFSSDRNFIKALKKDLPAIDERFGDNKSIARYRAKPSEAFAYAFSSLYLDDETHLKDRDTYKHVLEYIQEHVLPKLTA